MTIVKSEQTSFWDIDGTLILPYDKTQKQLVVEVYDAVTNKYVKMAVHEPMVRLLREERHRGGHIIVWSRGGYEWATNVIRALDLTSCVHMVMSKPMVYFDDQAIESWLQYRVYLDPKMQYKKPFSGGSK